LFLRRKGRLMDVAWLVLIIPVFLVLGGLIGFIIGTLSERMGE
jgi:hypothetical protein